MKKFTYFILLTSLIGILNKNVVHNSNKSDNYTLINKVNGTYINNS